LCKRVLCTDNLCYENGGDGCFTQRHSSGD
jgi:hypothetical protein